jgi:leucyl-tRNA synthetase
MGKRCPEFLVNPSDVVNGYGADTLRLYEMFMGPLEVSKPWSDQGVEGARRFLNRVWAFFTEAENIVDGEVPALEKIYHKSVKKITEDFEKLAFNTAISQMMIFVNAVYKEGKCPREYAEGLIKMLSCICPHVGEEMWQVLGHNDTIAYESWPTYDESKCADDSVEVAVQVNGKLRATVMLPINCDKDEAIAIAKADEKVQAAIEGKTVIKEISVPNKIVNIVVK